MKSENSKTSKPHVLMFRPIDKIDLRRSERRKRRAVTNLSIYYTWKEHNKLMK